MTAGQRRVALSFGLIAVVAFFALRAAPTNAPPPPATGLSVGSVGSWNNPVPATAEELQVIAPWTVGTTVDDRRIVSVIGRFDGFMWIVLAKDRELTYLQIAQQGPGPTPLASARGLAIFAPGRGNAMNTGDQALADRLAAVLTNNASVALGRPLSSFHRTEGLPVPPGFR